MKPKYYGWKSSVLKQTETQQCVNDVYTFWDILYEISTGRIDKSCVDSLEAIIQITFISSVFIETAKQKFKQQ